MIVAVTGATGNLGGLVVDSLIARGLDPANVVAVVRTPTKAAKLADQGVQIRQADYDDLLELAEAFEGVDRALLISSFDMGRRVKQHSNVIRAAGAAGVSFLAYTSILQAAENPTILARDHRTTEVLLAESRIGFALLRNGAYWENYLPGLRKAIKSGTLYGVAGNGRIAGAARADYAAAAAEVLATDGHEGNIYELGGDEHLTSAELAQVISSVSGVPIHYENLAEADYAALLELSGVPAAEAKIIADSEALAAEGVFDTDSGHLQALTGRRSTPAALVFTAALTVKTNAARVDLK